MPIPNLTCFFTGTLLLLPNSLDPSDSITAKRPVYRVQVPFWVVSVDQEPLFLRSDVGSTDYAAQSCGGLPHLRSIERERSSVVQDQRAAQWQRHEFLQDGFQCPRNEHHAFGFQ